MISTRPARFSPSAGLARGEADSDSEERTPRRGPPAAKRRLAELHFRLCVQGSPGPARCTPEGSGRGRPARELVLVQDTDEYTGMSSVEPKRQRRKTHGALGTGAVAESSVGLELSERRTGLGKGAGRARVLAGQREKEAT